MKRVIAIANYKNEYKLHIVVNENNDMLCDGDLVGYFNSPAEAIKAINTNDFTTHESNKFNEADYSEFGPIKLIKSCI